MRRRYSCAVLLGAFALAGCAKDPAGGQQASVRFAGQRLLQIHWRKIVLQANTNPYAIELEVRLLWFIHAAIAGEPFLDRLAWGAL